MTSELIQVANPFDANVLSISGTQFQQQGTFALTILCGVSGNAVIPIRCDSTGKIENTT